MKFKWKDESQTWTIKGVDHTQMELIYTLLMHVQLGYGDVYKNAAFEFLEAFDQQLGEIDPGIKFGVAHEEDGSPYITVESNDTDYF